MRDHLLVATALAAFILATIFLSMWCEGAYGETDANRPVVTIEGIRVYVLPLGRHTGNCRLAVSDGPMGSKIGDLDCN